MDEKTFFDYFYKAVNVPLLAWNEDIVFSYGYPREFVLSDVFIQEMTEKDTLPGVYMGDEGYYGILEGMTGGTRIVPGPAFAVPVDWKTCSAYMRRHAIPTARADSCRDFLNSLPRFTFYRFLYLLLMLEYQLHGRSLDLAEQFNISSENYQEQIARHQAQKSFDNRENHTTHGSYQLELTILNYVREGNPAGLEHFFSGQAQQYVVNEGQVGNSPLRQRKNIFLASVAIVGKFGAIPGGMDVEETYQLIDSYSMECERQTAIAAINDLQYNMTLDFARRVERSRLPGGISSEIFECIQYINAHINEPIAVEEVAAHIHRSRAYTAAHFKEALGFNIGQYITHARIQEAKSLLLYSDKSLKEISSDLAFSSQSYFQNVFKSVTGMTPMEFRNTAQFHQD